MWAAWAVLACCLVPASAPAAVADRDRLDRTVRYLQDAQNADGGFGAVRGAPSDPGISAWAALGLAAAGINPFDQARPGGADAATYLLRETRFEATTDYERAALVAIAAGIPLRDWNGVDLVARILERQLPDGSFAHDAGSRRGGVNDTAFAILALGGLDDPAVRAAVQRAATWLLSVQNGDGGWEHSTSASASSTDITGAVVQALRHAGRGATQAEQRALDFLRKMQREDGGFAYGAGDETSNTASTAWAVQALWAAGVDPRTWTRGGRDPLAFLASMQQPDGEIRWKAGPGGDAGSLWMTAYAAPAFAGLPWPVPPVARRTPPQPQDAEKRPAEGDGRDGGKGGTDPAGGGRVLAGGGGDGAPLFSRPQPQSRGRSAGGVRRTSVSRRGRRRSDGRKAGRPTERRRARRSRIAMPAAPAGTPATAGPEHGGSGRQQDCGDGGAQPDAAREDAARAARDGQGGNGGGRRTKTPAALAAGGQVTGRVVEDPRAAADEDSDPAAAPGLRGVRAGGDDGGPVAIGLGVCALAAAALGAHLERRRPRRLGWREPT